MKALATEAYELRLLLGTYMVGDTDFCKLSRGLHMHAMTYTYSKSKLKRNINAEFLGPLLTQ